MRRRLGAVGLLVAGGTLAALPPSGAADDPWAGVTWAAPSVVSPAGVDVDRGSVWQLDDGSQLALWSVYDHPNVNDDGPAQVWTSTRPTPTGTWSAPVQLTDYQQYFSTYPNFAWTATASGAAVVAWTQYDTDVDEWTYRATTRSPGGTWSAPATLATGDDGSVGSISSGGSKAVAVRADGRATVAFTAREVAASVGENSADMEVYRTVWSGSAWSLPQEVSVETPQHPIICAEPDPDDCPDREGPSDQPTVVYDGLGQEWIGWVHSEGANEAAEDAGVFLRGPTTTQLASGSEAQPRTFGISGIAADPDGGVALTWSRQVAGVTGSEVWAHAGGDVTGTTNRVVAATSPSPAVRSVAMRDGRAIAVVALPPTGIDGSRSLATAVRAPGGDAWTTAAEMLDDEGDGVVGTSGQAVLTPAGVPVVGYVTATSDQGRALAPDGERWRDLSISGSLEVSGSGFLQSFALTPADTLLAAWLSTDDADDDRLHTAASAGLPGGHPTPPPPTPVMTAPATVGVTTAASHTVRWNAVPGASYDVRLRRVTWRGTFGSPTYPAAWQGVGASSVTHALTRGTTNCYAVRARTAGGTSAWSAERCMVAPLDQTALVRSAGWTVVKGGAYYGGSAALTSRTSRSLARSGAALRRVGIVATTCPTCGVVDLFVGAQRVGRINLARGTAVRHRQVLLVPAFSPRSGKVRVVVVSQRRAVRVDGLVVAAR